MTIKEILEAYLRKNGFDGLCHAPTECGCGLGDLIGPCEGAQPDCKPAYKILDDQGEDWFTIAFDHKPSEEEIEEFWEGRT